MKLKRATLFSLVLLMPLWTFASSKNSAKVTFESNVMLGDTQIPAGDYRVQWEGNGTSVKVSILQGKKVIVTAPATLVEGDTPYDQSVELKRGVNNSQVVQTIEWRNRSLRFDQAEGPSPVANTAQ